MSITLVVYEILSRINYTGWNSPFSPILYYDCRH